MGAYRTREIVPADFYGKGKFYDFENLRLRGVEKYDELFKIYLWKLYGITTC